MSNRPIWSELSAKELGRLCPSAAVKTMRHRAEVYAQGDRCGSVFGICDGQVKLARDGQYGRSPRYSVCPSHRISMAGHCFPVFTRSGRHLVRDASREMQWVTSP